MTQNTDNGLSVPNPGVVVKVPSDGVTEMTTASFLRPIDLVREELNNSLIERQHEVEAILTALIAGQHVLLVGPPGTAKSLVCRALAQAIDCRDFEVLLTKFSSPEEIFGPLDVSGLKAGRYERITTGTLAEAEIGFVDEFFKGSSAIANALLTAMNERKFKNGINVMDIPLITLVAASNEWPVGEGFQEAAAIFDRFLIRRHVKQVATTQHRRLIWDTLPPVKQVATLAQIQAAQATAMALPVTKDAEEALSKIIAQLRAEGIMVGDRRLALSSRAVRAACYLRGGKQVEACDLEILSDILWVDPKEHPTKARKIIMSIANPTAERVVELLAAAEEAVATAKDFNTAIAASKKCDEIVKALGALEALGNRQAAEAKRHVTDARLQMAKEHIGV